MSDRTHFGGDSVTFGGDYVVFGAEPAPIIPWVPPTPTRVIPLGLRVLATNEIQGITADSENANFPITNTLDNHPKRKYKADAGDYQATLTIQVSKLNSLCIFGTNAKSILFTVGDPNGVAWEDGVAWETGVEWENLVITTPVISLVPQASSYAIWVDLKEINAPVTVELLLVTDIGGTLEVGAIRAGMAKSFPSPSYGLQESLVDYSIRQELSNGATYYRKRDIVRQFSGELRLSRDKELYDFMYGVIREGGAIPLAWALVKNSDNWVVFGRPEMPQATHDIPVYSSVGFQITEVI